MTQRQYLQGFDGFATGRNW